MRDDALLARVARANPVPGDDGRPARTAAQLRAAAGTPAGAAGRRRAVPVALTAAGMAAAAVLLVLALPHGRDGAPGRTTATVATGPPVRLALPLLRPAADGGTRISLDRLRGRWVVVDVVADWCDPCRGAHLRVMADLARTRPELTVLVIATRSSPTTAARMLAADAPYVTAVDSRDAVRRALGTTAVPETHVLRPDGTIAASARGPVSAASLRGLLEASGAGTGGERPVHIPGGEIVDPIALRSSRVPVRTPVGEVWLFTGTRPRSAYTLVAAASGQAVFRSTQGSGRITCLDVVPADPQLSGGRGCDDSARIERRGATMGTGSGDGRMYWAALLPKGRTSATLDGIPVPVIGGVVFASVPVGGRAVLRSGGWRRVLTGPIA